MNSVNIFQESWLDIVFEGKNKSYGAYQLRRENTKTTITAFFIALALITAVVAIPFVIGKLSPIAVTLPLVEEYAIPVNVSDVNPFEPIPPQKATPPAIDNNEVEDTDETQLIDPVVVPPDQASQNVVQHHEAPTNVDTPNDGGGANQSSSSSSSTGSGTGIAVPEDNSVRNKAALDRLPEFPGGMPKFYAYVGNNFEALEIDENKSIRVFVSFVIEKDGTMTDIKVAKDPGYGVAQEAIRVLKSLKTKWSPGMIKGQPVRTEYSLPITVKI